MMLEHDIPTSDLFGLGGTFPRPGWVVLDAARDRRFTGEIVFETNPQVRAYLDRGDIYLAERVTDPSLGARLVDAGALNAAQLEHGSLRLAGDEHLGRLFERVPSVDRHAVLITAELMTDECVGWLAHQRVDEIESTPYRHHPSGVHRWDRSPGWVELAPGDPLPAPDPYELPVELVSPEPLFAPEGAFTDDMIQWDEPSWLDERPTERVLEQPEVSLIEPPADPTTDPTAQAPVAADVPLPSPTPAATPQPADTPALGPIDADDWVDRLGSEGLPHVGDDPLASTRTLPTLPVEPADRFEVIWPSGEIDEQFGATDVAVVDDQHPDLDRAGPTARLTRTPDVEPEPSEPLPDPSIATTPDQSHDESLDEATDDASDDESSEPLADDVVLAVRRAVASIETGSLATRRRLAGAPEDDSSRGVDPPLPARVAARTETSEWAPGMSAPPQRSVFDDLPVEVPVLPEQPAAAPSEPVIETPERTSALRRLIGSLRRR